MSLRRAVSASILVFALMASTGCPEDQLVDPLRISAVHFEQTVVAPGQTIAISAVVTNITSIASIKRACAPRSVAAILVVSGHWRVVRRITVATQTLTERRA